MTKKELRKIYLDRRKKLSKYEREQMSSEIFDRLTEAFDLKGKKISIFLSIDKFNEVNTRPYLTIPATFILPVVEEGRDELDHVIYVGPQQLKISDWGIPEPVYGETFDPAKLDMVIVPLLAYDMKGYRVGYGKGFYDRFLNRCKEDCLFIGVSFFEPETQITDTFEGDIPLHYCVTPQKIYSFEK